MVNNHDMLYTFYGASGLVQNEPGTEAGEPTYKVTVLYKVTVNYCTRRLDDAERSGGGECCLNCLRNRC